MKKLIIHIGYPKTASTTIQLNVFKSLYKNGEVEYLNHIGAHSEDLGSYIVKDIFEYSTGFTTVLPVKELELLKNIELPISILSNESLSHVSANCPNPSYRRGVYDNLERLHNAFKPYYDKIELVMVIRDQSTMIHSYYTQEFFNIVREDSRYSDMKLWIQDNFGAAIDQEELMFNYFKMYQSAVSYFGEDNTHVLLYEDLIHNKEKFMTQWASILGKDSTVIKDLFDKKAQNVTVRKSNSRSTDKPSIGSKLSLLSRQLKVPKGARKFVKTLVPKKLTSLKMGKEVEMQNLSKDDIELINKQFGASNLQLSKQAELNIEQLKSFGYPIGS
ncbi:hypothetical protein Y10_10240 [Neptunitalea sp. Y10]|uniref:Sulfotransferase domain-containing protein n=2 Tax=Neptunitalea lumnitzerae TaxID=2965509 RepID=A0ABQ5MH72_9FLAO|nr:hypothetical protein Y10_10240 [Neptunitalea sp. Y10]